MSAPSAGPRLRRTWPQRLLLSFLALCVVAAGATAYAIGYLNEQVGDIHRVRLGDSLEEAAESGDGSIQNYLLIGVDSASSNGGDNTREGQGGIRSDTIMLLRLGPGSDDASLLSIPRDLLVAIPGHGEGKINSAFAYGNTDDPDGGGQRLLIETIKRNFQVDINHFVQVDWDGFKSIIDAVDGIRAWFPTPARDKDSGLGVDGPHCSPLNPEQTLAYARSRHYEAFDERTGEWVTDQGNDLTRNRRQQDVIRKVMRRAIDQGVRNPFRLKEFIDAGVKSVVLDDQLTVDDIVDLGRRYRGFVPSDLKAYNLAVTGETLSSGAQVLHLSATPENRRILDIFRGATGTPEKTPTTQPGGASSSTTAAPAPSAVQVSVLNGSGVAGQAGTVTTALAGAGFQTGQPGDSPERVLSTTIKYPAAKAADARLVARYFPGPVELEPATDVLGVTVVSGPEFTALLPGPKPADQVEVPTTTTTSTTTTTTTPPTTTTAPTATSLPTRTSSGEIDQYNPDNFVAIAPPGESCG